jgi:trafficking protein particle complex subunit 9
VVIPPNSYHLATITGKAKDSGVLTVKGYFVQAPGGAKREFLLPLSTEEEETRQSRRRSALINEIGRAKYGGLDSLPWETSRKRASRVSTFSGRTVRYLECKVVPEQPLIRIRRTSLTHGALMLYSGEQ